MCSLPWDWQSTVPLPTLHTHIRPRLERAQILPGMGSYPSTVGYPRTKVPKRKQIIHVSLQDSPWLTYTIPFSLCWGKEVGKKKESLLREFRDSESVNKRLDFSSRTRKCFTNRKTMQ